MILVYPPVSKPCQAPGGVALLIGGLRHVGVPCVALDLNTVSLRDLLHIPNPAGDSWSLAAQKNMGANIESLRSLRTYRNHSRYSRAVHDLNRLLWVKGRRRGDRISLANYESMELAASRSGDLLQAAEYPEKNPFHETFRKRLIPLVETRRPDIIGISINYLNQAFSAFAAMGLIRRRFPGVKLVAGGGLITSWMTRPGWMDPFAGLIDRCIPGAGENDLLSLVGKGGNGRIHCTPDFDDFDPDSYLAPGFILPYSTAKGCFWNRCAFCSERTEDQGYTRRPAEKVHSDLRQLVGKYNPALIHFLDNAISPAMLGELVKTPPGPSWYGFTRFTPRLADEDFCRDLKSSGCVMLQLGLESGNQEVLDRMRKGIDLETASRSLKTLRAAGIGTYVYLLFGTPWEVLAGARDTLDFTVSHAKEIDFLNLSIFNLPRGCDESRELEITPRHQGDLTLYDDFVHPAGWDRQSIRRFLDKEFKRHPAVKPILSRTPPAFTSNHAPFFLQNV